MKKGDRFIAYRAEDGKYWGGDSWDWVASPIHAVGFGTLLSEAKTKIRALEKRLGIGGVYPISYFTAVRHEENARGDS